MNREDFLLVPVKPQRSLRLPPSQRLQWERSVLHVGRMRRRQALLEFLLFYRPSDKWPAMKDPQFWNSAAEFVERRGKGRIWRSGEYSLSVVTFTNNN